MNKLINYLVYVTGALPFVRQGLLLHLQRYESKGIAVWWGKNYYRKQIVL